MRKNFLAIMLLGLLLGGCSTPWFDITFKDKEEKPVEDVNTKQSCEDEDCDTLIPEEVEVEETLSYETTLENFLNGAKVDDSDGEIAYLEDIKTNSETFQDLDIKDSTVGVVMTGKYEGFVLKNAFYSEFGDEIRSNLYLYNPLSSERLFLENHIDNDWVLGSVAEDVGGVLINDFKIPELNRPSKIYLEDFEISIDGGALLYNSRLFNEVLAGLKTIDTPFGELYINGSLLYKPLKDNFYTKYYYDAGQFWLGPNDLTGLSGNDASIEGSYAVFNGGCGWFDYGYFTVKTSELDLGNLELIGENENLKYYRPLDADGVFDLDDGYERRLVAESWNTFQFKNPDALISFEEFFELDPVIFWKDPFGNYSTLVKSDMIPNVECDGSSL